MIGKTLGHYQITNQLGKGGMGEVFQAKDQVLGRDVAIKVLPDAFARDSDRVARFQREAKVLASLNHPNIAAIYGLEQSEGKNFLILELVEGQTLADKIKTGPIPVEESLKLALQIAEALEAAHEKGIIHRDLKPANIKVTPDGKAKVLDFGLAKAYAGEQEQVNLSNSPTLSDAATQQGVILGTAAYMSPEQAKGKAVDKRADIWAFGVVVFEMLTGRQVFAGETVSDTLASVLAREPKWQSLPSNLHPRIRLLLDRCLKKEPRDRYSSISDGRVDIQEVLADPSGVLVQPVTAAEPRRKLRAILPWAAATLALGLIIAGVAAWKLKPTEPRQVVRFDYELPESQQFSGINNPGVAISPDGKQFVYCTSKGLYLLSVNGFEATLIPGTEENPSLPFFSPDGKWVGYFAGDQLKKIPISGGAPVALCSVRSVVGAIWNPDNTIVYAQFFTSQIMRVSANGGTPESLIKEKSGFFTFPQILPDGETVLFGDDTTSQPKVVVQSLKSGKRKELFAGDNPRYLPTGHIIYGVGNNLFAVPFNLDRLEAAGGPVSMVEGVFRTGDLLYAVSDSGVLAYVPVTSALKCTLVWVDRNGKEEPIAAPPNAYSHPRISPNGTQIALTVASVNADISDIWIWSLLSKTLTRLTFGEAGDTVPLWTPDGKRIAFSRDNNVTGLGDIYWKSSDGTGKEELLISVPDHSMHPCSWSGNDNILITQEYCTSTASFDIGEFPIEGDRKWKPLLNTKFVESQPRISPDGQWMAYTSDESGRTEIYVRPFPDVDKGGRWQVSTSGGDSPLWSPDGRELFYRSGDAVMAAPVRAGPTFGYETPKKLFQGTYVISPVEGYGWDISHDGKRFLMIKEEGSPASPGPRKINIVLNWTEELKQRVPVK